MTKQVGSPNISVQIENRIWCFNIEIATIQIHAVIHFFPRTCAWFLICIIIFYWELIISMCAKPEESISFGLTAKAKRLIFVAIKEDKPIKNLHTIHIYWLSSKAKVCIAFSYPWLFEHLNRRDLAYSLLMHDVIFNQWN